MHLGMGTEEFHYIPATTAVLHVLPVEIAVDSCAVPLLPAVLWFRRKEQGN